MKETIMSRFYHGTQYTDNTENYCKDPCFRSSLLEIAHGVYKSCIEYDTLDSDNSQTDIVYCDCMTTHFKPITVICTPLFINPGYGWNSVKVFDKKTGNLIVEFDEEEFDI